MSTEKRLAVLACHLGKDEERAKSLMTEEEWSETCKELVELGFLEWKKSYEHKGNVRSWGVESVTLVYTRVLTSKGLDALAHEQAGG